MSEINKIELEICREICNSDCNRKDHNICAKLTVVTNAISALLAEKDREIKEIKEELDKARRLAAHNFELYEELLKTYNELNETHIEHNKRAREEIARLRDRIKELER